VAHELKRPPGRAAVHLCIDMQRIFSAEGIWATPWMEKVLPVVVELASRFPHRTIFTRFMTPHRPDEMPGTWRCYYNKWRTATRSEMSAAMLDLLPALQKLVPPAIVINKTRYSAFAEPDLAAHLRLRGANCLIITGSETDVCVLATVLGAVDLGFRVILVQDAICSSSDEGHDALLDVYHRRYAEQIEIADAETILRQWT
jgi:nicotinamidase-related amidase